MACTVRAPRGRGFAAFPSARTYTLRFPASFAPMAVHVRYGAEEGAESGAGDESGHWEPAAWHNAEGPSGAGAVWGDNLATAVAVPRSPRHRTAVPRHAEHARYRDVSSQPRHAAASKRASWSTNPAFESAAGR